MTTSITPSSSGWLRKLCKRLGLTEQRRKQKLRCPLRVECLEERSLLAVVGGLSDPDQVVPQPQVPLPEVGVPFVDPAFGTTIRRVSDSSANGGFETQIYSQLQAFSSDNAYLLLVGSNGYVVRRMSDFSLVEGLDTSEWNAPRWSPTLPHTLIHYDTNADEIVRVQYTDLDTLTTTDVFTFPSQYQRVFGNQSFDEVSEDGRWMAGMVQRNDGEQVIFAVDLEERRLGAVLPLDEVYTTHARPDPVWGRVTPDWVGVSPLGNSLVVAWARDGTEGGSGVETFDLQTGEFLGRVNDGHQHGDLDVMPDGQTEYYMTFEIYGSPSDRGRPAIGVRLLPGDPVVSEPMTLQSLDWGNGEHISGQGPNGVGLITSGSDATNGYTAFEGELWLQYTDGSVLRLAHHRSTSRDYWVQPRASISRDGRYIVFASDWGRNTGGRGDPYVIDLGDVLPPPAPPGLTIDPIASRSIDEGSTLTLTATAQDVNGDTVQFALADGAPEGAVIDADTGEFSWTPTEAQGEGTYSITVLATDDGSPSLSASRTFQVTVGEVNEAPVLDELGDLSVVRGRMLRFTATASDADLPANALRFSLAPGAPASARINATTGAFSWRPSATRRPGTREVTVRVTDNGGLRDVQTVTISIVKRLPASLRAMSAPALSTPMLDAGFASMLVAASRTRPQEPNSTVVEGVQVQSCLDSGTSSETADPLTASLKTASASSTTVVPVDLADEVFGAVMQESLDPSVFLSV